MRTLRMISLCAGIGDADRAAERTGAIEVVGQVENDPFCQAVLAQRWPHVKRMSAMQEFVDHEFGPIDIVAGGLTCQSFSRAGKQHGQDDDRYLWPQAFVIITTANPTWVLIENVADFTCLALDDVQSDLESQDYAVQAFVLPACAIGAPYQRAHCFVVAYSARSGRQEDQVAKRLYHQYDTTGAGRMADAQGWTHSAADRCAWGQTESKLGRGLDGLSARLDSHRWPTLPGQEQESCEPPRTIKGLQAYRNQRLKALGNAIVPQQIYPLFY